MVHTIVAGAGNARPINEQCSLGAANPLYTANDGGANVATVPDDQAVATAEVCQTGSRFQLAKALESASEASCIPESTVALKSREMSSTVAGATDRCGSGNISSISEQLAFMAQAAANIKSITANMHASK